MLEEETYGLAKVPPPALDLMMKNLSPCLQLMYWDRPGGPQVTFSVEQLGDICNSMVKFLGNITTPTLYLALHVQVFLFALNQAGEEGPTVRLDLVNLPHRTDWAAGGRDFGCKFKFKREDFFFGPYLDQSHRK